MLKLLTVLGGLVLSAGTVQAQDWRVIPCEEGALAYPGLTECAAAENNAPGSGIKAVGGKYGTRGRADSKSLNLLLYWPAGETFMMQYSNADAIYAMKHQTNDVINKASNWGELRSFGQTSYMTFRLEDQHCVGFDHPGPYKMTGYAWVLRGTICQGRNIEDAAETVRAVIAKTRVGK